MSELFDHEPRSDDAAAYALGALEEHEATEFRAHAEGCQLCAAELEFFIAAGALLPLAPTPLVTPKSLKATVMKAAAFDAKAGERKRPARSGSFTLRAALGGAASLAAAVVLAVVLITPGSKPTVVTRATVAAAAVWHTASVPVARLERNGNQGQLVIRNLPETASGKVYEVWIERHHVPLATDVLFEPNSNGDASVDVPGNLDGAQAVLVTAERSGGAKVPSMSPLIKATLPA